MRDFITRLQEKPYESKLKILWGTVFVAAVILVVIFVFNIKNNLKGVNTKSLIQSNNSTASKTALSDTAYASVERIERTDNLLKIYFNFNNSTDDILSISKLEDIDLSFNNDRIKPKTITDRQGKPFVQKILSHTQNFGILTFDRLNTDDVKLTFDMMFFEKDPSKVFRQDLELNLNELSQPIKVRN
jgi:hypothetical protein